MADTIIKLLKETVSSHPEAVATRSKDSKGEFVPTSYIQLYELVNAWGAGLLAHGVKRGDHLGLISENRKEWLISDLAILGIGAVDVPRGSDSTADELKYILKHADCSITMAEDSVQLKKILSVKKELPLLKTIVVMDDKFRNYAEWDSLAVLSAGAMINEEYDIVIPRQKFDKIITVGELYDYINKKFKG